MPHEDQCWGTCVVCGMECCKDALHVSMSGDPCQCTIHRSEVPPSVMTKERRATEDVLRFEVTVPEEAVIPILRAITGAPPKGDRDA